MLNSLSDITNQFLLSYFLVFCRVGSALMTMPAIAEVYVAVRIRLIIALILSFIVQPIVSSKIDVPSENILKLTIQIFSEVIIGIGIGMLIKFLLSAIYTAGTVISSQSGLSSAMMFDPNSGAQGSVEGNFLGAITIVLIFATDLHHQFIAGIIESYTIYNSFSTLNFKDIVESSSYILNKSFQTAFKLSAPHLVVGIILMFSAGILSRLMPAMQIFFIIMPVQILISFIILMLTVGGVMMWYVDFLHEGVGMIFMK
ncbi:MAG: flagellar biosynthetic protein FliR [Sphingobacteriia bacterium]|nr:flagellar biosynthetic protein FliR [Sphingobacteriia bacterium]